MAVIALMGLGLASLFNLGLEGGESYPIYSTFRSDPLGTGAIYGALGRTPGVRVSRNIASLKSLPDGEGKTLVLLGAARSSDPLDLAEALEEFMEQGGRLVITMRPVRYEFDERGWMEELLHGDTAGNASGDAGGEANGEKAGGTDTSSGDTAGPFGGNSAEDTSGDADHGESGLEPVVTFDGNMVDVEERWGFDYVFEPARGSTAERYPSYLVELAGGGDGLPGRISWRTRRFFAPEGDEWSVVYEHKGRAAVMERRFGKGSLAMVSDTYFLSNEGLRSRKPSGFIAWMVGPSREVIFDETHLGVEVAPGIMGLIRRFNLDWFLGAMAIVTLLFVWRNASSLVPKRDVLDRDEARRETGRDSSEGLVNLLRRNVPSDRILALAWSEYRRSFPSVARDAASTEAPGGREDAPMEPRPGKAARIEALLRDYAAAPPGERDPALVYNKIGAILKERKTG